MDGPTLRRLITEGLTTVSHSATRPERKLNLMSLAVSLVYIEKIDVHR